MSFLCHRGNSLLSHAQVQPEDLEVDGDGIVHNILQPRYGMAGGDRPMASLSLRLFCSYSQVMSLDIDTTLFLRLHPRMPQFTRWLNATSTTFDISYVSRTSITSYSRTILPSQITETAPVPCGPCNTASQMKESIEQYLGCQIGIGETIVTSIFNHLVGCPEHPGEIETFSPCTVP